MFFGPKKVIGLDIGSTSIKLAELDVSRKGAVLQGFGMIPTPNMSINGGDLVESTALSEAISQLVQGMATKRKSTCTGLWGSSVIVKRISVPTMDEDLLSEQIRWEAEQYIPFNINEVNIDFQIIRKTAKNSETMDVLLIAARHDVVLRFLEVVNQAALSCEVLDLSGLALANCFEMNYGVIEGQSIAIINSGASLTNLVVVENGEVTFCRDIPVGGGLYTSEIQKGMGITLQEAEAMKMSVSMGQPGPEEVTSILNQTHEAYAEEIGASIDFYLNAGQGNPLSQCFITGGGSKVSGLIGVMSRSLKIPCALFDPFMNIRYNEKLLSSRYINEVRDFASVAIGLGLRKPGDS